MPKTKYFRVYTGYASTATIYNVLKEMAEHWQSRKIINVRIFFAGLTDVYLSIKAGQWYHWSVANDPDWPGDAEDFIIDSSLLKRRQLASRPRPEDRWQGSWREFGNPDDLLAYAQDRLDRLINTSASPLVGRN